MGAERQSAGAPVNQMPTASSVPMAAGMPYPTMAQVPATIPMAEPVMQPMQVQAAVPPQQSCAVNCMQITSMVIGVLILIGAVLSLLGGDWGGVVLGLISGTMIVTGSSMWACECCGNKRQNGRTIQRLLFAASLVMVISIIVGFVRTAQMFKCEKWRDDPPDDVVDDFNERDDKNEGWDEWSDGAKTWCVTARAFGFASGAIGFVFVGLVLATGFLTRQQLARWDMISSAEF